MTLIQAGKQATGLIFLLLLCLPSAAQADGLTELRATLQKLQSDQLLRAKVEIKNRRSGGESDKQKRSESVSNCDCRKRSGRFEDDLVG